MDLNAKIRYVFTNKRVSYAKFSAVIFFVYAFVLMMTVAAQDAVAVGESNFYAYSTASLMFERTIYITEKTGLERSQDPKEYKRFLSMVM